MNERDRGSDADVRRIDLEAAAWLVKHDRGLTAAEQDEFSQWLAADARHGEWLARHRQSWRELDLLAQWRPEHSVEPNPDLLARPRRRWGTRWLAVAGLAIAASVVIGLALWRPFSDAGRRAGAFAIAEGYERRVLEDGSIAELNRGAAIDARFTAGERRVTLLSGEAHFTVTKNPERPFVVRAHEVDVRAVGTAFDVRLDHVSVEVLVTEGRVAVKTPATSATGTAAEPPLVVAGQRAVVSLTPNSRPQVVNVSAAQIAQALAWQPQLLDFSSTPLARVIEEFNRRNRVQLVLADAELEALPIVASIRSDNVDGFARLLESTAGIRAEFQGRDRIILRKR